MEDKTEINGLEELTSEQLLGQLAEIEKIRSDLTAISRYVLGHLAVDDYTGEDLMHLEDLIGKKNQKICPYHLDLIKEVGRRMNVDPSKVEEIIAATYEKISFPISLSQS